MIYKLKETTKYYADKLEEAEDKIREEILSENNGHVVSQKITQKKNKDFGDYYEFEITKEF